MKTQLSKNTRGQSETVGYVILLSVVLLALSATMVFAVPSIQDAQQTEYMMNTERAFTVLDNNFDDISQNKVSVRSTEIKLDGGSLYGVDSTQFNITATDGLGNTQQKTSTSTPITYERAGMGVHYNQGAVFFTDKSGYSVMREEPKFSISRDSVRLTLVSTTITENQHDMKMGSRTIITARGEGTDTVVMSGATDIDVTITVIGDRYETWRGYFVDEGFSVKETDASDNSVTLEYTTDTLYVREKSISVS